MSDHTTTAHQRAATNIEVLQKGDEYQHLMCNACYPREFGPYPVALAACGRVTSHFGKWSTNRAPKCPDCMAIEGPQRACYPCLLRHAQ